MGNCYNIKVYCLSTSINIYNGIHIYKQYMYINYCTVYVISFCKKNNCVVWDDLNINGSAYSLKN